MVSRHLIRRPLHLKLLGILLVFLLFIVGLTVINSYLSTRLQGLSSVINDAGSERMRLYRILYLGLRMHGPEVRSAASGEIFEKQGFQEEVERFQEILYGIRKGGSLYNGYRPSPRCRASLDALIGTWEGEIFPLLNRTMEDADSQLAREALHRYEARVPGYVAEIDRYVKMNEKDIEEEAIFLERAQWGFLLLALGLIGFASVAAYQGIHRPVQAMLNGMERMGRGEFRPPIVVASDDEMGLLARGLNALGEELEKAYRSLENRLVLKKEQLDRQETRIVLAKEREYFVRLLHDEIAQRILFLLMQVRVLREKLSAGGRKSGERERSLPEELPQRIQRLADTLHETHREVRRVLTALIGENENENENERPFLPRLRKFLSEFEELNDTKVELNVESWLDPLPPVCEAVLFGAIREGVINAYKYAGANCLRVTLAGDGDLLRLVVQDNGKNPKEIESSLSPSSSCLGLRILGNRIREIGGLLDVVHIPEGGTTLTVVLPVQTSP